MHNTTVIRLSCADLRKPLIRNIIGAIGKIKKKKNFHSKNCVSVYTDCLQSFLWSSCLQSVACFSSILNGFMPQTVGHLLLITPKPLNSSAGQSALSSLPTENKQEIGRDGEKGTSKSARKGQHRTALPYAARDWAGVLALCTIV